MTLALFALTAPASEATFSPCRRYRYTLTRAWDPTKPLVAFIGLNPSTADETTDDPTIRRCVGFAKAWGLGGIVMLNLFAWRSTDPDALLGVEDPVGPENDAILYALADETKQIERMVACWGAHASAAVRGDTVATTIATRRELSCLGRTKAGAPKHPLYLAAATPLEAFRSRRPRGAQ